MVLAKSKNTVGLGNSLMNDRFGKGKGQDMRRGNFQPGAIKRTGQNGETVRHHRSCYWAILTYQMLTSFLRSTLQMRNRKHHG